MRLSSKNISTAMLAIILVATTIGAPFASDFARARTSTETVVKVEPEILEYFDNAVGKEFTVAVEISDVTNLYGFDIKFRWNTTFLDYVSRSVRVPRNTYLDGVLWNPTLQLSDEVDASAGTYWIGYSSIAPAPVFNGTGTVFTITFSVKYHPVQPEPDANITLELYSTDLAAKGGNPISHIREHGTVMLHQVVLPKPSVPLLKVMPIKTEKLPTNSSFNIDIWIMGLNQSYDIANFSITLSFNFTLMKAINIEEGSWPKSYAEDSIQLLKQINNVNGTATCAIGLVSPRKPEPPTTGILFTVTFHVIYESMTYPPPSSELILCPTIISDRTLGPILHARENGTYTANRPPPVAKFTWYPKEILLRGQTMTFNASESYHPLGGKITLYTWDFGDNTKKSTTNSTITHAYTRSGNFTVVLSVTDYGGFWDYTSTQLYIVESPPEPYLAVEPTYIKFGPYPPRVIGQQFNISIYIKNLDPAWSLQNVRFSLSYNVTLIDIIGDSANVTISRLWRGPNEITVVRQTNMLGKVTITLREPSIIPSGNELAATINFTVMYQGIYPAIDTSLLALSDIELMRTVDKIPTEPPAQGQIAIKGLSPPLQANFTYYPLNPKANEAVTFNASNSTPNDFNIANYTWNFGDGNITSVEVPIITHYYSNHGTYNITLTITDIDGLNNTTRKTMTVEPAIKAAPDITTYAIAVVAIAIIAATVIYFTKIRKTKGRPIMRKPVKSSFSHG